MEQKYICKHCGKICKNIFSLKAHENTCKKNPNRRCLEGKNNPNYGKRYNLNKPFKCRNKDILDKTNAEIEEYRKTHFTCEICGKSNIILCIDHDHVTKKFRGLLCQACNRALGWYENNKENIEKYLARWENS